jgi:hypothetical protein
VLNEDEDEDEDDRSMFISWADIIFLISLSRFIRFQKLCETNFWRGRFGRGR